MTGLEVLALIRIIQMRRGPQALATLTTSYPRTVRTRQMATCHQVGQQAIKARPSLKSALKSGTRCDETITKRVSMTSPQATT